MLIDRPKVGLRKFEDVEPGESLELSNGDVYIRLATSMCADNRNINAVRLSDGYATYISHNTLVTTEQYKLVPIES